MKTGAKRSRFAGQCVELGTRVVQDAAHVVPRRREYVACDAEIICLDRNNVVRVARMVAGSRLLRSIGGRLDLRGQHEQIAPGLHEDLSNVDPRGRHDIARFAVVGGEHVFAHAGEAACLRTPRIPLCSIIVDQWRDV